VNRDALEVLHVSARAVAALMRLPLRRRAWRGIQGDWQGLGTGNSLDFQDHRPYVPGDDLRHLNWQAYARTGHYTMKLFRQDVSPAVDLAVDLSGSMFLDEEKSARTAELLYWSVESALEAGASLRCFAVRGSAVEPLALDDIMAHDWARLATGAEPPAFASVPWRHGSLRVILSDLLWPGEIQPILQALDERQGSGHLLAPYCAAEAEPHWAGNLQMLDCETEALRLQRMDRGIVEQYRAAYARHFGLWEEQALRYRVPFARIPSEPELAEALRPHVAATGVVEWAH
jgi:uncharacterized protein (DUF58 family)